MADFEFTDRADFQKMVDAQIEEIHQRCCYPWVYPIGETQPANVGIFLLSA
jgi:hypothetical protein